LDTNPLTRIDNGYSLSQIHFVGVDLHLCDSQGLNFKQLRAFMTVHHIAVKQIVESSVLFRFMVLDMQIKNLDLGS